MNHLVNVLTRFGRVFLFTLAIAGATLHAQSTAGTIEGRVYASSNNQNLQGAIVRIIGLDLRAETDRNGIFYLRGVPEGNHELETTYFGVPTARSQVTVSPGKTSIVTVNMSGDEVLQLEKMRVEAQVLGQARAINQQRTADAMVNITSEEMFGETTDNNIAKALQRIPGISANSDGSTEIPRYINIRGFDATLNSVQLNGARLPTTNDGTSGISSPARGFALDDLPANSITNIEIVKSPTPDMDGDAVGGIVNLITKSAFDRGGRIIEFKAGADYVALRDKIVPHFELGYANLLMEDRLGVRFDLSYYKGDEGFDNIDYDWLPLAPNLPSNLPLGLSDSSVFAHEDTEYNNYFIERTRYGISASIDYKVNDTTTIYFRPVYTTEERVEDDRRFHKIMDNDHARAAPTTAVSGTSFADTPIGSFYNAARGRAVKTSDTSGTYSTYTSVSRLAGRTTLLPNGNGRGSVGYRQNLNQIDPDFYSVDFGGASELAALSGDLKWGFFYSEANRPEIRDSVRFDRNAMQWAYDRPEMLRPDYRTIGGPDPYVMPTRGAADYFINPSSSNLLRTYRDTTETVWQAKVDFSMAFTPVTDIQGTFKSGLKIRSMEREHDRLFFNYRLASFATYDFASYLKESSDTVSDFRMGYHPDTARILQEASSGNAAYTRDTGNARLVQNLASDYQATEDSYEGYLMGVFDVGSKLQLITGVRAEQTKFEADTPRYDINNPGMNNHAAEMDSRSSDYTQILPGVHLRYEAKNNIVFRAAYTHTYARPSFRELIAVTTLDDVNNVITTGNPDLEPYKSENWDVSWEYFGKKASYFQAALFHKKVWGQVLETGETLTGVSSFNGLPLNSSETYTVTTFSNQHDSRNMGIELVGRYRFVYMPAPFDGFYLDGSITYTDSDGRYADRPGEKLPTYGGSELLYFAGIGYQKDRIAVLLSYRYRSEYLEGLENVDRQNRAFGLAPNVGDDWWGEEKYVNLETSYRVAKNFRVYCNISNLNEFTNYSTQSPFDNDYPEDSYWHKMRVSVGVKGTF